MLKKFDYLFVLTSVFTFYYFLNEMVYGFEILQNKFSKDFTINSPILDLILNITSYIPLLILILSIISIFSYKFRGKQIIICRISLYLSLFMSFYTLFYFYFTLEGLVTIMPSKTLEVFMYTAMVNPFVCSYLIYLALRSIIKDNELVKSLDRIR